MFNSKTAKALEDYGRNTLAVVLNPINTKFDCVAIVQCDELCNLDGGRELFRFKKNSKMPLMKLHGSEIKPQLILTTPNCKNLADTVAKQHQPCPVQLLFN
jgi:hypothetical protein